MHDTAWALDCLHGLTWEPEGGSTVVLCFVEGWAFCFVLFLWKGILRLHIIMFYNRPLPKGLRFFCVMMSTVLGIELGLEYARVLYH